jgi:hypothetical protein
MQRQHIQWKPEGGEAVRPGLETDSWSRLLGLCRRRRGWLVSISDHFPSWTVPGGAFFGSMWETSVSEKKDAAGLAEGTWALCRPDYRSNGKDIRVAEELEVDIKRGWEEICAMDSTERRQLKDRKTRLVKKMNRRSQRHVKRATLAMQPGEYVRSNKKYSGDSRNECKTE